MTKLVDYTVAREHQGDRITDDGVEVHHLVEGDTRAAHPSVVASLVKSGVQVDPNGEKAEPAFENKAEPVPANKAEGDDTETKVTKAPAKK